jgi:predicted nucleotidyltransferase
MDERELEQVARRHGIVLLLQFGSTVTGRTHPASDIDLAVLVERTPRSLGEHADLLRDLQAVFPGREVDLALINRADPLFLRKITEQCRLLHGSPARLAALKMYAFRRYQDHRKYLALEREYVARSLRAMSGP